MTLFLSELPDELRELIFLRVYSEYELKALSLTCRSFRVCLISRHMINEIKKKFYIKNRLEEYYINSRGKKHGDYKLWYSDGTKLREYAYKDGLIDDKYIRWYSNGNLRVECTYKNDLKNGEYKRWYPDGTKWEECTYKDGKLDGDCKSWHSDGTKYKEFIYKDGKLIYEIY